MKAYTLALGLAIAVLSHNPSRAATLVWDPTVDSCTALNCGSLFLAGTVGNIGGVSTQRWDVAIYANAGECLRIHQTAVLGSGVDDEMVVVAPDGTVYRDDDSAGGLRPRVVIQRTPSRGWYYVSIARFTGAPSPEHDFYLRFGRYVTSTTNPNCTNPTTPRMEPTSLLGKSPAAGEPSPEGAPSAP